MLNFVMRKLSHTVNRTVKSLRYAGVVVDDQRQPGALRIGDHYILRCCCLTTKARVGAGNAAHQFQGGAHKQKAQRVG